MRVNFYATLRQVVGGKTIDIPVAQGITLQGLIDEVIARYPGLRRELLDENGKLYRHVHVFVNGRDAPHLDDGLQTKIEPEDVVDFFPAVAGGVVSPSPTLLPR